MYSATCANDAEGIGGSGRLGSPRSLPLNRPTATHKHKLKEKYKHKLKERKHKTQREKVNNQHSQCYAPTKHKLKEKHKTERLYRVKKIAAMLSKALSGWVAGLNPT